MSHYQQKELSPNTEAETKLLLQTTPGLVMGTPSYMSPEQARGLDVDRRTDIFSLGVVLYEMLAGRLPFAGASVTDLLVAILHDEPPSLLIHRQDTPAELERIVMKTLRKDRDERYQTAQDLLVDLKSLQKRLEFDAELERTPPANEQTAAKTQIFKAGTQTSIAVLPFSNMSADAENEYFCDGLAEELLNALAKIDDLKVAARTSAFSFKGKNTNVSEIGSALNVKTVLEGSVRKSGNHLRITVQLVNASDGYHLWSERYDREMKDIFDVQDELTLAVVDALKVKLFGEEKAAVLKRYTNNTEAYLLYLKGMYYRWKLTPGEFGKCRDFFQRAVDADPSFALAYFGLSSYYGYGTAWGLLSIPPNEGWAKAEAALAKVMELDDTLPEVHLSLEAFRLVNYREWDTAGKRIEHAAGLNPNFPEIHHLYSFYLLATGRFDDAISEGKRALELDPLSLNYSRFLGIIFYFARRYDEAIEQFTQALEFDPNDASVYESLCEVFVQKGMFGEALVAWQRALTLVGNTELAAILKNAYAETDFAATVRVVAQKRIERMRGIIESGGFVLAIGFARAYIMLGDTEQAFHWLGKACEERNVFPLLMNSDPFYDSLRGDPRFENLRRRIGLKMNVSAQSKSTNEAGEAQTVLLAPATTDAKETPATETITDGEQTPRDQPKVKQNLLVIALLGLSLLAAVGFGVWYYANRPADSIESIAVLPFVNRSGNADMEYLSDGMTESLITSLSQLPNLNIKARSSVFRYKGRDADAKTVGRELSVQAVLTGRVIERGQDLTLYVELVNAATENVLWKADYNRQVANLATLQSEIARDVADKLRLRLSGADAQKLAKNYTENAEAYQLYLQGLYHLYKLSPPEIRKSVEYFQRAVEVDPNYALAYADVGRAYYALAMTADAPSQEVLPRAREAAVKALQIDDTLAQAHTTLGWVKFWFDWDWKGAEQELQRSLSLNPNVGDTYTAYAHVFTFTARHAEALPLVKRARELDPLNLRINALEGQALFYAGKYDDAIVSLQKTLELEPNFFLTHLFLARVYIEKEMYPEAIMEAAKARDLSGGNSEAIAHIVYALAKAGRREEAQAALNELKRRVTEGRYVPPYNLALAYNGLGKTDEAIISLEKGLQQRDVRMILLKVEPKWNNLRGDPRFQDLLRRVGFPP